MIQYFYEAGHVFFFDFTKSEQLLNKVSVDLCKSFKTLLGESASELIQSL